MEQAEVRTMPLPVKLNEIELAIRAQELGQAEGRLSSAETRLDQAIEDAKATKKQLESEVGEHRSSVRGPAAIVRDRREIRDVPIMEEPDYEAGAMNTYRTDLNEIVATRGLTAEERQRSLFNQDKKRKPS
jgi:hypothetical protein